MELQFVDTTFRDGSQSLWAAGMRPGMMEAIAEDVGQAGFKVVEVPVMPLNFKKIVRELKEDPWEMAKILAEKMPDTTKSFMGEPAIFPFEIVGAPEAVVKLYYERIVATGVLNRVQIMANIFGNVDKLYPWYLPFLRSQNLEVALALSYTVSPRHTDEYYAQKMKELVEMKPDVIYLKDQGGLLTVHRMAQNINAGYFTKLEWHSSRITFPLYNRSGRTRLLRSIEVRCLHYTPVFHH